MHRFLVRLALALVIILATWGVDAPTPTVAARSRAGINPSWVTWNAKAKTVTLSIIAAYNGVGGGFNFNGYNQGHLTITVPQGARVVLNFTNKVSLPHSALITPYDKHTLAGNFPVAFAGAATPNATSGVATLSKPQTITFTAAKAGTFALVCGVPGHASAGMWDAFTVARVDRPSMTLTSSATSTGGGGMTMTAPCPAGSGGAVGGTVQDATSGRPLAHVFVIVGWTTLMRVGETNGYGQYCIRDLPNSYVDAFGFAEGYVYYHGHPITIHVHKTVDYAFKIARQTFAAALLPRLSAQRISRTHLRAGDTATFSVHVQPGKGGQMSGEVFAANSALGHAVLLRHVGADLYSGTWRMPLHAALGAYTFTFFGAMHNCLENAVYPREKLTVGT